MNRRDLLKLFGVGSAAVPLIGGVPEMAGAARIIAPPQVELYREMPASMDDILEVSRERVFVSVDIAVKRTGKHVRFLADSFVIDVNALRPSIHWNMQGIAVEGVPEFRKIAR